MRYDNQYYLLSNDAQSGNHMICESNKSDDGLDLLERSSIKRQVLGKGHVAITMGDDDQFSPCDYHHVLPSGLISEKFKEVLTSFNLPGVDFYETVIETRIKKWNDRYLVHIWQNYRALHQKRSKIDGTFVKNNFILEGISLDENLLDKIPLKDRLVFRLNENPKYLYHESVVAAIKVANLTGVRFICVKDWGLGSAFEILEDENSFYDDL